MEGSHRKNRQLWTRVSRTSIALETLGACGESPLYEVWEGALPAVAEQMENNHGSQGYNSDITDALFSLGFCGCTCVIIIHL